MTVFVLWQYILCHAMEKCLNTIKKIKGWAGFFFWCTSRALKGERRNSAERWGALQAKSDEAGGIAGW